MSHVPEGSPGYGPPPEPRPESRHTFELVVGALNGAPVLVGGGACVAPLAAVGG